MKSKQQRINNIIGQLEGINKMLSRGDDCLKVLTQLKAVKSAISGVMDSLIEDKFDTCLQSVKTEDKKLLIQMKSYVKSN